MTRGQLQFSVQAAALTGLDVNVIRAWELAEMRGSYAAARERARNFNWLNIGYFDALGGGRPGGRIWSTPASAANATVAFLEGRWLNASASIQGIRACAGQPAIVQLDAIAASNWAANHYGNGRDLRLTYALVPRAPQPKRITAKWRSPSGAVFTLGR